MKQKIVIDVPMHSDKRKSKAMTIAVAMEGVSSVSLGKQEDRLEVIGEGVDSVDLVKSLRKKFCFAKILTVEEVKPPKPPEPPKPQPCCYPPPPPCCYPPPPPCCYPPPPPYYACTVYDSGPPSCCLM